jgi:hypothetical protein
LGKGRLFAHCSQRFIRGGRNGRVVKVGKDGTYTEPTAHVAGRKALVDHIGAFFEQFPGAYFVVTSGIDSHHGKFRFTWRMVLADGKVFLEGVDFGELNSDGKLHRIVGFLDRLPKP